jgi:hypothetical protein
MTKLHIEIAAPTWREAVQGREATSRQARVAEALRNIADRIQNTGFGDGEFERPGLTATFRFELPRARRDAA